jgi:hypothetical protein
VITHHLHSSLLPYETGLEYQREVRFDGTNLKLTARSQEGREQRQRTLVWTRISDSGRIAAPPAESQVNVQDTPSTVSSAAPLAHTEPPPRASGPESGPPPPVVASKYGDMPTDYKAAIRKFFQEHLKHAESVQYQEITKPERGFTTAISRSFLMSEKREYGWTVKATINAQNSRDSYVGFKTYTFLFRGEKIVDARLPLPGDEMN